MVGPASERTFVPGFGTCQSPAHASSSSSAFASFRSGVSKPSVNQPYTDASRLRASARRPWSRRSSARLAAARNSQSLASCFRAMLRALRIWLHGRARGGDHVGRAGNVAAGMAGLGIGRAVVAIGVARVSGGEIAVEAQPGQRLVGGGQLGSRSLVRVTAFPLFRPPAADRYPCAGLAARAWSRPRPHQKSPRWRG
jgi:hypothetical protein